MNATRFGPDSLPPGDTARRTLPVLGAPIDVLSEAEAVQRIGRWAREGGSRYVCVCNAHSVVTTTADAEFARAVAGADMATADGAPVAWMLRRLGAAQQRRVSGPELMLAYCAVAAQRGEAIFLYGSTATTLQALQQRLRARWPALRIAGALAPPFRPGTAAEDAADVQRINASGARTVWVSLGCPKQELWMAQHRGRIQAVMVGVGAAFDFHAGTVKRAPAWIRHIGLEWLYRLFSEPRRLWRRYLVGNTVFVLGAIAQWARWRR